MIRKVKGINQKLKLAMLLINYGDVIENSDVPVKLKKEINNLLSSLRKEQLFDNPSDYIIDGEVYNELKKYLDNGNIKESLEILEVII